MLNPRLYLLVAMSIMMTIMFQGMRFSMVLNAVHTGASPALVGLLGATAPLFPILLSLRLGRRIDRHGPRQPMITACILLTVSGLLGFIHNSLVMLFVMAVLSGIANNAWFLAHQQLVGYFSKPEDLAASYSLSSLGFSLAGFIAPVAFGYSIEHFDYASTFALLSAIPLLPLFTVASGRLPLPGGKKSATASKGRLRDTLRLLHVPILRDVLIVNAAFEASWTLFSFLTPILGTQLGLSSSTIGIIVGSMSATGVFVRFLLPVIVRRVPHWRLLTGALGILAVAYLGFSLSHSVALLVGFAIMIGLGQAVGAPLINALLYEKSPAGRAAEVLGLRSTFNNTSQALLPVVSGALGALMGIAPAFWLLSGAMVVGIARSRAYLRKPPPDAPDRKDKERGN